MKILIQAESRRANEGSDFKIRFFQSKSEGEIIDFLHKSFKWAQGVIINPAALTHYSYALLDALRAINLPAIEVHLSDITKRETFRKRSVAKDACLNQISGRGVDSYLQALDQMTDHLLEQTNGRK